MTNKEIKLKLMKGGVKFSIPGKYNRELDLHTSSGYKSKTNDTIAINTTYGLGMNVDRFGSKMVHLYTYDMLCKETKGVIDYQDVKFK